MTEWIKCSDRLPDEDDKYLLFMRKGLIMTGNCYNGEFLPDDDRCYDEKITHWAKLPEAPHD